MTLIITITYGAIG